MGRLERRATVTPASPTTLVNAPKPMICAPIFSAILEACSRRRYVNSGLRESISLGVPPTLMSQPSASAPVGETMLVILQYTMGGMWAAMVSILSIKNFGVALGMGKAFLM